MTIPFQNPNPAPTQQADPPKTPTIEEQVSALRKMIEEVIDERVSGFNDRLQAIEQQTAPPPPEPAAPQAVATDDDIYSSPAQTVTRIAQAEAEKAMNEPSTLAGRAMVGLLEQQLASQDPDFELLKPEYEEFRNTLDPKILAWQGEDGTNGVQRAFWSIRGRFHDKLVERKAEREKQQEETQAAQAAEARQRMPYVERGRGRIESTIPPGGSLTDEQKKVVSELGMTEEQYKKSVEAIEEGKDSQYDLPEGY
jgi:hypothetical protein